MNSSLISFNGTLKIHEDCRNSKRGQITTYKTTPEQDRVITEVAKYISPCSNRTVISNDKANLFLALIETVIGKTLVQDFQDQKVISNFADNKVIFGNRSYINSGLSSEGVNMIYFEA